MINSFKGLYHFLSNFQLIDIPFEGITYPSIEHFYMAQKTTDLKLRQIISKLETPGQAKRIGRELELRPDWNEIKFDMMRTGLELKFQDVFMQSQLMETGQEELLEGNNWHDNIWGSCYCPKCGNKGENNLGKMLMEIRQRIRTEQTQILP